MKMSTLENEPMESISGINESNYNKIKTENQERSLLHIKGFPPNMNVDELKELSSDIISVRKRNSWDKYAFLEFQSEEIAERNYHLLQDKELYGCRLIVSKDIRSDNLTSSSHRNTTDTKTKEKADGGVPSSISERCLLHIKGFPLNMDVIDLMQLSSDIIYVWKRNSWDKHAFLEFKTEDITERNYHLLQDKEIYGCRLIVSREIRTESMPPFHRDNSEYKHRERSSGNSYSKRSRPSEYYGSLREFSLKRTSEYHERYSKRMKYDNSVRYLLHVKGLLSGVNLDDLKKLSPDIICVYKQKKRDNYAFLEFKTEELAEKNCQELQDKEVNGCKIVVSKAEQGCKPIDNRQNEESDMNEDETDESINNIKDLRCTLTVKRFPSSIKHNDLRALSPDILNVIKIKNDFAYLEFESEEIAKRNYYMLKRKKIGDVQLKIFLSRKTRRDWNRKERYISVPNPIRVRISDIPLSATVEDVKETFPKALDPVLLRKNRDNCTGIVTFKNERDAAEVLDAGSAMIKGEKVRLYLETLTPQEKGNYLRRILIIEGFPATTSLNEIKNLSPDIIDIKKINANSASLEFETEKIAEGNYHYLKTRTIDKEPLQVYFKGRISEDLQGKRKLLWFENPLRMKINYLPLSATVDDIKNIFPKAVDVQIMLGFGYALMTFKNETDATEAFGSGCATIKGTKVYLSFDMLTDEEKGLDE